MDIRFPKSWYTVAKSAASFVITCKFCEGEEDEFLSNSAKNPLFRPATYSVELKIMPGYYESMEDVVNAMNNAVAHVFVVPLREKSPNLKKLKIDEKFWPKFRYNERNRRVSISVAKNMSVQIGPALEQFSV